MSQQLRDAVAHAVTEDLTAALGRITHCVGQLTDEQVWWRPRPDMNSIGNLMLQAQAQFQVPLIFAGLIVLAVEGIVMYALMAALEARTTRWAQRSGFAQG